MWRPLWVVLSCVVVSAAFAQETAKSAILYIGDGMGLAQVTAGRIYQGNARDGKLAIDTLERIAVIRTYAANRMVTDSAAAGTALASGRKTNLLALGQGPDGERLDTVLELAKKAGKSVGLVTTTTISHATPAAFYAHIGTRANEAAIAAQLIDYGEVDVIMGGGRQFFMPETQADPESDTNGERKDGRDLFAEARAKGYRVIMDQKGFDAVAAEVGEGKDPGKILALFSPGMMAYEVDRSDDKWGEPSLAEMTRLAVRILQRDPDGFFLMVEGGRIDHAAHDNEAYRMVGDMLAFDHAVAAGLELVSGPKETLVVVTADHETGGLAINGYPPLELKGTELFTTPVGGGVSDIFSFSSGPGANRDAQAERPKDDPRYKQPALFQAGSAAHTGVDVLAWATGPGSEAVKGTMTNAELGELIIRTLGLR